MAGALARRPPKGTLLHPPHRTPPTLHTTFLLQATLDLPSYLKRLAVLYAAVFVVLGAPIAAQTFDPWARPMEWFLSASTGALLVVAVASLRIYLGWNYVGARLLTATLEYEETGW